MSNRKSSAKPKLELLARDLVAQDAIFGDEVLIAQQQFLIDGPRDRRQQVFPVHGLSPAAFGAPIDAEYG